jgi:surface protein
MAVGIATKLPSITLEPVWVSIATKYKFGTRNPQYVMFSAVVLLVSIVTVRTNRLLICMKTVRTRTNSTRTRRRSKCQGGRSKRKKYRLRKSRKGRQRGGNNSPILGREQLVAQLQAYISNPIYCRIKYGPIKYWNTTHITDMSNLFGGGHNTQARVVKGGHRFVADLSQWDVSNVQNMSGMFAGCSKFNSDLSKWDVANVQNMSHMFVGCSTFNSDLSKWQVVKVTNMSHMFEGCSTFKSDLGEWNVSNVTDMSYMFASCNQFTANLDNWNMSDKVNTVNMFAGMRRDNYPTWYNSTQATTDLSKLVSNQLEIRNNINFYPHPKKDDLDYYDHIGDPNYYVHKDEVYEKLPAPATTPVCDSSGNCLALGKNDDLIVPLFSHFRDFTMINPYSVKRIGANSLNGTVVEVPFVVTPNRNEPNTHYTAYTVLKCATKPESDNLFYEYFVGKRFINNYLHALPCFVKTYGVYMFRSEDAWSNFNTLISKNRPIQPADYIEPYPMTDDDELNFGKSCQLNKRICVLTQHFKPFLPFHNVFNVPPKPPKKFDVFAYMKSVNIDELCASLYQVYFCLSVLKDRYTHYDLHAGNVCLYKPYGDRKYILMRYHYDKNDKGQYVEFKSEYIAKIIDYGRNYIKIDENPEATIDTKMILQHYIRKHCDYNEHGCGFNQGYAYIQGNACGVDLTSETPSVLNNRYDLRLAHIYRKPLEHRSLAIYTYSDNYPENVPSGMVHVTTVMDLCAELCKILQKQTTTDSINKKYLGWTQASIMDVYCDDESDYTFVPTPTATS